MSRLCDHHVGDRLPCRAFAITMWAIVASSLASPVFFRLALQARARSAARAAGAPPGLGAVDGRRALLRGLPEFASRLDDLSRA
jgi:hypothetical protein